MSDVTTELYKLSASELSALYAKQKISPVEVFEACYERIDELNPKLNCFNVLDYDRALLDAQAAEQRWQQGQALSALDGVPTTIKDCFNAIGWPTLYGSKTVNPKQIWDIDAPVTAALRQAGTVLLGTTTMPEYGWKGVTDSPLTGITRNPWNLDKTPGGSSGGAASGVASAMFPLAIGTDGGGSIRIPASFSGVFGLKPSYGLVPMVPPSFQGRIVHAGPITRTVQDAAALMNVIAFYEPSDCYSVALAESDYTHDLAKGVKGLNIAFSPNLGMFDVDAEVSQAVEEAVKEFEAMGATVTVVNPSIDNFIDCFNTYWLVCMRNQYLLLDEQERQLLDENSVELAKFAESIDLYHYYNAQQQRRLLTAAMNQFFQDYDLLITPTEPMVAFDAGQSSPNTGYTGIDNWTPFTCFLNLTGHPAASIPCGFSSDGLPIGLQIVSGHYRDKLVLQACHAYEQQHPIVLAPL